MRHVAYPGTLLVSVKGVGMGSGQSAAGRRPRTEEEKAAAATLVAEEADRKER